MIYEPPGRCEKITLSGGYFWEKQMFKFCKNR